LVKGVIFAKLILSAFLASTLKLPCNTEYFTHST